MPAELWAEATALAHELDVNTVRRAAGIDYGALRQRVDAGHGTSAAESADAQRFVEVGGAAVFGAPGPVIELTDATGTRLTVRLAAGSELDLGRLVASFRGRS
jgi:2-hydroxychromene-2-carboxylate isomerase